MTGTTRESTFQAVRQLPLSVLILIAGIAVNRMGNFVQIFLMLYLTRRMGYAPAQSGLVLTAYGVGAVVGVFVGGALISQVGSRRAIVGSMTVSGLLVAAIPAVAGWSPAALVVMVTGAGIAGQLYRPAATAFLAQLTPPGRLLIASAAMRLGLNTGAAFGPLLGSLLALASYTLVFVVNAATALAFAAIVRWLLPPSSEVRHTEPAPESPRGRYLTVLRDTRFLLVVFGTFLVAVAEIQYQTALPLVIATRGYTDFVYSFVVALNAALIIVIELPLTQRLREVPARLTMSLGSLFIGLGLAFYGAPGGIWLLVTATIVWTIGEAVSAPPMSAYPALTAPTNLRGHYIGLMTACQSIGYAVGPVLGATLYGIGGATVWFMCAALGVGAAASLWCGARSPAISLSSAVTPGGSESGPPT